MATQFLATLGVAFFVGMKLDAWIGWKFPLFLILLPLLGLAGTLWAVYKDTNSKP
ncbi:MAG: AtpZ/AtpI family protein [Chitinophagaceae bacterium]|nr:AtpZ/AtpI family protein [Chitinophagaceae bacterium]